MKAVLSVLRPDDLIAEAFKKFNTGIPRSFPAVGRGELLFVSGSARHERPAVPRNRAGDRLGNYFPAYIAPVTADEILPALKRKKQISRKEGA